MIQNLTITLLPEEAAAEASIKKRVGLSLGIAQKQITGYKIEKRSIDARGRQAKIILQVTVFINEPVTKEPVFDPQLKKVNNAPHVVIAGAGPAGLFAALRLIS